MSLDDPLLNDNMNPRKECVKKIKIIVRSCFNYLYVK